MTSYRIVELSKDRFIPQVSTKIGFFMQNHWKTIHQDGIQTISIYSGKPEYNCITIEQARGVIEKHKEHSKVYPKIHKIK